MCDVSLEQFLEKINKYEKNLCLIKKINGVIDKLWKYEIVFVAAKQFVKILEENGLANSSKVAVVIERSPQIIPIILGILQARCIFCPAASNSSDVYLKDLNCEYVIKSTEGSSSDFILLKNFKIFGDSFFLFRFLGFKPTIPKLEHEYCYSISTSGTTGKSKTVNVPWNCIWPNINYLSSIYNLKEQDVILPTAPTTFDPFILDVFLALNSGASLVFVEHMVTDMRLHYKEIFNRTDLGATIMQITPSVFQNISKEANKYILDNTNSSLRVLVLGGELFPQHAMKNIITASIKDKRIFNIYGITEVSCWATIYEIDFSNLLKEVALGQPIDPSTILDIRDCDVTGEKTMGQLYIGSRVRKCLLSDEQETNILNSEDIIFRKTGDLVEQINGDLYYRGRSNSVVKRFGHRVSLSYIEDAFFKNNDETKAVCMFDEHSGDLLLFHNRREKFENTNWMTRLKASERPNHVVFVEEFPINRNGKIDKNLLLKEYKNKIVKAEANDSPNIARASLLTFLSRNLQLPEDAFSICTESNQNSAKKQKSILDSSFLSLGGTSIHILAFINELESISSYSVDPKMVEMLFDSNCSLLDLFKYVSHSVKKHENLHDLKDYNFGALETPPYELKVLWKYDTKKCVDASPTLYQHFVSVGSHSHSLCNLDSETGNLISSVQLPDRIEGQITFDIDDGGTFGYVGCYNGYIYKFIPSNGMIVGSFDSKGMIKCRPLILNDLIVFGNYSEEQNIFCLNKKQLSLKWSLKLGQKGVLSSPVSMGNDLFLVCTLSGICSCLQLSDGERLWTLELTAPIFSTSFYISDLKAILIADVIGKIHLISADGRELSTYQASGSIFSSFEVHKIQNGEVLAYFGCFDLCIYCIRVRSDHIDLVRKIKLQSTIYSTPKLVLVNNTPVIVCCSSVGIINVLHSRIGTILGYAKLDGEIFSSPCCSNGKLYVGCRDNYLYCLQIKTRAEL